MKRRKFTDEQILSIVKEGEAGRKLGRPVPHVRDHRTDLLPLEGEVRWDGAQRDAATQAARRRESPTEADRGRADARHPSAQGGGRKKMVSPIARREAVGGLLTAGTSLRRACRVTGLSTATWRYQRRTNALNATVLSRLQAHAAERPRFGYRRLHILLDREGVAVNHKRIYRVYRAAGLQVRRRRRKRLTRADRVPLPIASQRLERWSIDFMLDTLADGRTFRVLNIVDDYTRECLAIEVDRSLPGARVVRVLERLAATVGLPKRIVLDNGLP